MRATKSAWLATLLSIVGMSACASVGHAPLEASLRKVEGNRYITKIEVILMLRRDAADYSVTEATDDPDDGYGGFHTTLRFKGETAQGRLFANEDDTLKVFILRSKVASVEEIINGKRVVYR